MSVKLVSAQVLIFVLLLEHVHLPQKKGGGETEFAYHYCMQQQVMFGVSVKWID